MDTGLLKIEYKQSILDLGPNFFPGLATPVRKAEPTDVTFLSIYF